MSNKRKKEKRGEGKRRGVRVGREGKRVGKELAERRESCKVRE